MPAEVQTQAAAWSLTNMITPRSLRMKELENVQTDRSDELLDLLENGFARESITQECLTPREPEEENCRRVRPHQRFRFKRIGKQVMELHTDSGASKDRFLLSAKKEGNTFYISPYSFDPNTDNPDQMRRCAVLKKLPYGASGECYKLFLDGCEGCDRKEIYEGVCEPSNEGKLLAEIWHSTTVIPEADMTMRAIRVTLPAKVKGSVRDQWETSSNSSSGSNDDNTDSEEPIQLVTKLPRWVPKTGCLTQKFHGNRVRSSSAKNFILTCDKNMSRKEQGIAMQFGKREKSQYILDHTGPLSTLQSFAIALSMCNWIGE
jgi:hypothetical protein